MGPNFVSLFVREGFLWCPLWLCSSSKALNSPAEGMQGLMLPCSNCRMLITRGAAAAKEDWPKILQHVNLFTFYYYDHMDKRTIRNLHNLNEDLINRCQLLKQLKEHIFAYVFSSLILTYFKAYSQLLTGQHTFSCVFGSKGNEAFERKRK